MPVPTVIASNNEDDKLADNMEDLLKLNFEII